MQKSLRLSFLLLSLLLPLLIFASADPIFDLKWTVTNSGHYYYNLAVDSQGRINIVDRTRGDILRFNNVGTALDSFSGRWDAEEPMSGLFKSPTGIAFDHLGNLYVVEADSTYGNRVSKFDSNDKLVAVYGWGVFNGNEEYQISDCGGVSSFSECLAGISGASDGQFDFSNSAFSPPIGIAVDSLNNFYVADHGNNRIQKFDSSGTFLRTWGWGVDDGSDEFQICTNDCQAGMATSTGGGLFTPVSIVIDGLDNVYVTNLNQNGNTIKKFDSSGNFITSWGTYGIGDDQVKDPQGIMVTDTDLVYVADTTNHRISVFDTDGNFIKVFGLGVAGNSNLFQICNQNCQIGFRDVSNGAFDQPSGIAVDSIGDIYIIDGYLNRLQKFTLVTLPTVTTGESSLLGRTSAFLHGEITDSGGQNAFVYGVVYGLNDTYGATTTNSIFGGVGSFTIPVADLTCNTTYHFRAFAANSAGTVYGADETFTTYGCDQTLVGFDHITIIGASGSENGQFDDPTDLAFDLSGNMYVVDSNNNRVQKFDSAGIFVVAWGSEGSEDGQFFAPTGIAIDGSGDVYVVDSNNTRIQKFDSVGNFLLKWGDLPEGYLFATPQWVAIDSLGKVYVTDSGGNRVYKFEPDGTYLTGWGQAGIEPGKFTSPPAGLVADPFNNIYVADGKGGGDGNHRIIKFDSIGTYLTQWGEAGVVDSQFNAPTGIARDSAGNIYVSDTGNNRIQKFDSTGTFLGEWGSAGDGEGEFNYPHGIKVDASGNVYVADSGNNRIQIFHPNLDAIEPEPESEPTPSPTPRRHSGGSIIRPPVAIVNSTAGLPKTTTSLDNPFIRFFTRDLTIGLIGPDVFLLQFLLNHHNFPLASSGPGSSGNETLLFGPLTREALTRFQAAYGLTPTGNFDLITRIVFSILLQKSLQ